MENFLRDNFGTVNADKMAKVIQEIEKSILWICLVYDRYLRTQDL